MRNVLAVLCLISASYAQTPSRVMGEVESKTADQITVKTDAGQTVNIPVTPETKMLRVPPGETSLAKATSIALSDINTGDRVLARANQIVVMSKSDLQQKQAAERAEWQKRGAAGKIIGMRGNSISITTPAGQKTNVSTTPKTSFRRYAPESVRFSDAKPSSFAAMQVGDQVRVLGDKQGDALTAEVIVSGAFRNFAGTVLSADKSAGEIKVTDLQTKKPVTVKIDNDSILRRMPPMMAQMMASRKNAAPSDAAPAAAPNSAPPKEVPGSSPGGMRGRGQRDIGQMLDRMPVLDISELKPGDALIVAAAGADPSRSTAISGACRGRKTAAYGPLAMGG